MLLPISVANDQPDEERSYLEWKGGLENGLMLAGT